MKDETIKELLDAGFPFTEFLADKHGRERWLDGLESETAYYAVPTLSELIEACGDDFRWLKRRGDQWMAQGRPHPVGEKEPKAWGATPDEAVALLWLALNKKAAS